MKGSESVFDNVDGLHYKCRKINLSWGGSYIDSPRWLKNNKAPLNPKNNDDCMCFKFDMCFKHVVTAALNYEKTGKNPQRRSKIYKSTWMERKKFHGQSCMVVKALDSESKGSQFKPN